ncbi:MAG: tetratricopeptide repeat protein, partial [Acidobacteriota bacterium]
ATEAKEAALNNDAQEKRVDALARFATAISYDLTDQSELATEQRYQAALSDPANERLVTESSKRLVRAKEFEKSIRILSKAAAQPLASGEIFSSLAQAYLASGKTNLAASASQSAIKKSPVSIAGYQMLTEIFLRNGRTNDVLKILNDAARQTNSDAFFLINLGDLYGKLARVESKHSKSIDQKGLDVLNRAVLQKPTNPNLRHRLADNYAQLGDWKKAAELYLELMTEFGDVPLMRDGLRAKLTNLYLQNSDKANAIEQLEAVVRDDPTRYPVAWHYLANFAYEATNYAKATEYFERALLLNPDLEQAYYDFAGMQVTIDHAGEALKILEKARGKFPHSFTAEFFTGLAYSHLKNYADAVKHFTTAEVIGTATDAKRLNDVFYFQLGSAHERNGDFAQAETYFQKSLELSPNFSDALNYLGFMWTDKGVNLEKARIMIEKAVKLEPKNDAYLDSLGWVLFKLKDYESALQYLLQAVQLSEKPDATVYDHLGDIYQALQQTEKARDAWKKSLAIEPNETIQKKMTANSTTL